MSEHDVIVIGAGPAGEVCSSRLSAAGLDVVLVERELVGGECAFWACMPSKALLRPAELLVEVGRVPGAREAVTGELDPAVVLARRDEVIEHFDDSGKVARVVEPHGTTLVRGPGRLAGERTVHVGDRELRARRAVVIAVGSGAELPPLAGLDTIAPWTSREVTTAEAVPERLLVLGGGVVGCEMAQAWASLGARVTLVEAEGRLLPNEEPFAGRQVGERLIELGAEIHHAAAEAVRRDAGGVVLSLAGGTDVTGDELLVAVGRVPHTADLGLETVGLEPGETIAVDDRMRVPGREWLYAVGDVNGRALLTHAAKYQARVAVDNILGGELAAQTDGPGSPRVVFTEPQVAAVGHTLARAREAGIRADAVDAEVGRVPGASFVGKGARSSARIVVDRDRDVIVGATFTGPEVADWLHAATIAIVGEVPRARLRHAVPPFPARTEVWLALIDGWGKLG